jgi:hypothetical protein
MIIDEDSISDESSISYKHIKSDEVKNASLIGLLKILVKMRKWRNCKKRQ